MSKLVSISTTNFVSKLLNSNKYFETHFALQATKFVVWDVVRFQAL